MKHAIVLIIFAFFISLSSHAQTRSIVDEWRWIVPLETKRTEIEIILGRSITKEKDHPFQTYETTFGKITIAYATRTAFSKEHSRDIVKGTVLNFSISLKHRLPVSEIGYDLTKFVRDASHSPRELSYWSEDLAVLIATEIVDKADGSKVERVFAIECKPRPNRIDQPGDKLLAGS